MTADPYRLVPVHVAAYAGGVMTARPWLTWADVAELLGKMGFDRYEPTALAAAAADVLAKAQALVDEHHRQQRAQQRRGARQ